MTNTVNQPWPLDLDAIAARAADAQQYGIEDDGFEQLVRNDVPALINELRHLANEPVPAGLGVSATPSRTDLRDRIRRAICEAEGFAWDTDMLEPDEYGEVADAVLAVLPSAPTRTDPAAVLRWAADQIDAETRQAKADGVLEPDKYRPCRDASAQLRDLADAIASCPGYEITPSPCRCPCTGCKHHCGAHDPSRLADEAQQQPETRRCPSHEPLANIQCAKSNGHEGPHSDRAGRIWYPAPVEEECCGAEPPSSMTDENGREWTPGDCWCTLPPGHDGEHRCQPCTDRHGAPGWTDEPAAAPQQEPPVHGESVAHLAGLHDDEPATDAQTLADLFEGFGRLLATSSRDWGQYRVDAWLYAVILGWDCEETVHDETCTHGAMEEMQRQHGWSDEAVAKARRYRAAVRALTQPAVDARQDGAQQ